MRQSRISEPIPVIDLFAGPGGLGEGFSSIRNSTNSPVFKIALSVEKDQAAHKTLQLRAFYRQFDDESRPDDYYDYVMNPTRESRKALFEAWPKQAKAAEAEAWQHMMCESTDAEVIARARAALRGKPNWLLIGGPPCQAYSLAGRSRRAHDESFAEDEKHTLYKRYLELIEKLKPPVFVMENVKGMLSAKIDGASTIAKVLGDLRAAGDGYDIYSFVTPVSRPMELIPSDYVIRAEQYGVPQARHRVILLGVRQDTNCAPRTLVPSPNPRTVQSVLLDLPVLRSRISRRRDSAADSRAEWLRALEEGLSGMAGTAPAVYDAAERAVQTARARFMSSHHERISDAPSQAAVANCEWYMRDASAPLGLNHETRSHMKSDIGRYLFCASFAQVSRSSPRLVDFPTALLPAHENVLSGVKGTHFADRFRVQLADNPSTTITSHISKDGHYYIHYDPSQCRSLSVREAARLQTFPDDYFFEGNRTQQYHQVGNAVPPYLAAQMAEVVAEMFGRDYVPLTV